MNHPPNEIEPVEIKSPEQLARALEERAANERAQREGRPLPYPNPWDELDPTKLLPEEATPERIAERYREFCKLCSRPKGRVHIL